MVNSKNSTKARKQIEFIPSLTHPCVNSPTSPLWFFFVRIQTSKLGITEAGIWQPGITSQSSLHPPAFVTDNNTLIFEEHQICTSPNLYQILQTIESGGLFVEDENKFIFCNVLVGHRANARFKISNVGKIACDVNVVVKPISNKVRRLRWPLQKEHKARETPVLEPLYISGNYLAEPYIYPKSISSGYLLDKQVHTNEQLIHPSNTHCCVATIDKALSKKSKDEYQLQTYLPWVAYILQ